MKKVLLLPGNSASNKEWSDAWAAALEKEGFETHALNYSHWGTDNPINFEEEIRKIQEFYSPWWDCYVVAKSIGSALAVYAVAKGILEPKRCVFLGMPTEMNGGKAGDFEIRLDFWLKHYARQTDVFQNEHDPITSFEKMAAFVKGHTHMAVHSVPGNTHKYHPDVYLSKVLPLLAKDEQK